MSVEHRREVLEIASKAVLTDRTGQYGSPENNFAAIADFWHLYEQYSPPGNHSAAHDVAIRMVLLKVARIATGHLPVADNYADGAGYFATAYDVEMADQPKNFSPKPTNDEEDARRKR